MSVDAVTRIIGLIVAPVVMVTSCAVVLGSLYARFGLINDRLRSLAQERRTLLWHRGEPDTTFSEASLDLLSAQRVQEIEVQVPDLLRRHRLLRYSVLAVYYATLVFFINMFAIALAVFVNMARLANTALLIFLVGTGVLAVAMVLGTLEVRTSHLAVEQDVSWVVGEPT